MSTPTARLPLPDLIVQAQEHRLECPLYRDGALVAPVSGTVTVYDANGRAVVDAQAVTITDSVATYTVPAALTSGRARGMGWRVLWSLTLADGSVVTPRNDAALVRTLLYPVVTDADLIARAPALNPAVNHRISKNENYQPFLDEAWLEIQQRLIATGNRPNLVTTPHALRSVHLYLTLSLIFDDLAARMDGHYGERAAHYRALYREAWASLNLSKDVDDDGVADEQAAPAEPIWWFR